MVPFTEVATGWLAVVAARISAFFLVSQLNTWASQTYGARQVREKDCRESRNRYGFSPILYLMQHAGRTVVRIAGAVLAATLVASRPAPAQAGLWSRFARAAGRSAAREAVEDAAGAAPRALERALLRTAGNAASLGREELAGVILTYSKRYARDPAAMGLSKEIINIHADEVWPEVAERVTARLANSEGEWTAASIQSYVKESLRNQYVSQLKKRHPVLLGEDLPHLSIKAGADDVIEELAASELAEKYLCWRESLSVPEKGVWSLYTSGHTNEVAADQLGMGLTAYKDLKMRVVRSFEQTTGVSLPQIRGAGPGSIVAVPACLAVALQSNARQPTFHWLDFFRVVALLHALLLFRMGISLRFTRRFAQGPALWSSLGTGIRLFGRRKVAYDAGSCVRTQALSLFFVPILALRAYRISKDIADGTPALRVHLSPFARWANIFGYAFLAAEALALLWAFQVS